MGPHLGLRGGFYAQYFAFTAKHLTFYAYGDAITPAVAAFLPSILLFQPSNFHFKLIGSRLGLRGLLLCPVFCFCSHLISSLRLWERD